LAAAAHLQQTVDALAERDFRRLSDFIYQYSGIKMPPVKKTMLEGRLRKRLRVTGFATIADYCSYLFDGNGLEQEAVHLIDVVTTNKTDFFREVRHFDYMAEHTLPQLLADGHRHIRAWSSACSTGAEPYTMAMVMDDQLVREARASYQILATDLSTDVLRTAYQGIYDEAMLKPVPRDYMRRYVMQPVDPRSTQVRISPQLRRNVAFARLNLMDPAYQVGEPMHIIFCRNVLIYFDKPTQEAVVSKLCDRLLPGGYLFIGHSESIAGMKLPVRQIANTIFRKSSV
jgi:chemotaxis protein methyltransferase CheR